MSRKFYGPLSHGVGTCTAQSIIRWRQDRHHLAQQDLKFCKIKSCIILLLHNAACSRAHLQLPGFALCVTSWLRKRSAGLVSCTLLGHHPAMHTQSITTPFCNNPKRRSSKASSPYFRQHTVTRILFRGKNGQKCDCTANGLAGW